jgi:hypothetical protein
VAEGIGFTGGRGPRCRSERSDGEAHPASVHSTPVGPSPPPSMQSPNGEALETTLGSRAMDSQTPTDAREGDFGGGEGGFGDEDGDGKYSEPESGTIGDFDRSAPSTVNPREPHAHVDGEAVAYSVRQDIVSETQPQFPDVNACTSQGKSLQFSVFVFPAFPCIRISKLQRCHCRSNATLRLKFYFLIFFLKHLRQLFLSVYCLRLPSFPNFLFPEAQSCKVSSLHCFFYIFFLFVLFEVTYNPKGHSVSMFSTASVN